MLLEKELFWQFFGVNVDVNSDNFALFSNFQTNDNAREALAQKLKSSFVNQKFLSKSGHVVQLNNLIGGISVTPSDYKLNALVENGSLTEGTKKKYEKELGLIGRYAKAYALPTGTVSLSDMPAVGDHRNQKFEAMMEITVPAKTTYQSSAFQEGEVEIQESPDPDDTTPPDPDDTTPPDPDDTTPPDPDDTTPPDPDDTTPPDPDDTTPPDPDDTTPPDPDDTTPPDPDDTTPPDPDDTTPPDTGDDAVLNPDLTVTLKNSGKVPKTYVIKLTVDLEDKTEKELVVTWMDMTNKQTVSKTTSTFGLVPEKPLDSYLGGHKFEYLTNLFNQIEVTSALISTLFGDPKNGEASLQGAVTKKDFEEASEHSIFHLYGNMDLSMLTGRLSREDVVAFQEAGSANIKTVVKTIQGLQAASAKGQRAIRTLDSQLPENYFASNIKSLQDWYGQATANIESTYQTWKSNDTNQLEVQSWSSYDSQEPELYIGDSSQLYKQISTLIDTTAKGAQTTVQIAKEVKDNSTEFDQLLSSAAETQNEAQIILENTNKLTSTGSQYLTLSKEYYTSFSTVLSNTRTKGVDTNKVYDFFAQPIAGENVTPKESILIEMGFDYRWVLVLLIGVVFGILVTLSISVIIKWRHARLQIKSGQGYQGRQTVLRGRDEASTAYRNYAKQGASDSAL